jgi:hypothetical protein
MSPWHRAEQAGARMTADEAIAFALDADGGGPHAAA